MPCSICHQSGHNKRTCPNVLISFKEAVVAPPPTFNSSSVEVEIGLISLVFQLPKEVELILQRLSRSRPLLTQHDIHFSQAKLEMVREKKSRGDFMNVWELENGRRWSWERSIPNARSPSSWEKHCQTEWGMGTSKNKTEYKLYYASLQFTGPQRTSAIIGDTRSEREVSDEIDEIEKKIKKLKVGAYGAATLREIQTLNRDLRECWKRLGSPFVEEDKKNPFKKLTMKSLPQYWGNHLR